MKNLLLASLLITVTCLSCSKENDTPSTPDTTKFEGTWRGELTPVSAGSVPTTWVMYVNGDGTVTQTHNNSHGAGTGSGTLTEDGLLDLKYDGGGEETGVFNANSGFYSGTATHGALIADSFGTKDP